MTDTSDPIVPEIIETTPDQLEQARYLPVTADRLFPILLDLLDKQLAGGWFDYDEVDGWAMVDGGIHVRDLAEGIAAALARQVGDGRQEARP